MVTCIIELIYVIFTLLTYLGAYILILGAPKIKLKKVALYVLITVCAYFCLEKFVGIDWLSLVVGMLIPLGYKEKKWWAFYPLVAGLCTSIESVINILATFSPLYFVDIYLRLICSVPIYLIMIVVLLRSKFKNKKPTTFELTKMQFCLLYLVTFCTGIALGAIELVKYTIPSDRLFTLYGVSLVLVCFIFYIVTLYTIYLEKKSITEKNIIFRQNLMLTSQKHEITMVLDNEKKLRSYKHDLYAHLNALQALANAKDLDGLENYCKELLNNAELFRNQRFTGNLAVDGVLNNIESKASNLGININLQIGMMKLENISDYDLCIIISNVLNNAIEACDKGDVIDFACYQYNDNLCLLERNPIHKELNISNGTILSSKNDNINHGFGINNIKSIVEKHSGAISISGEDQQFNIEIII